MSEHPHSQRVELTPRELQVVLGMAGGKSNGEIGRKLYLSEDTVKTHARRLFRKLGAVDRAHAVALAVGRGVLIPDPDTNPPVRLILAPAHADPAAGDTARAAQDTPSAIPDNPVPVRPARPAPGARGTVTLSATDERDVALLTRAVYPREHTTPWAVNRCRDALRRLVGA